MFVLLAGVCLTADAQRPGRRSRPPILGRWDVKVQGHDAEYPSWFEVRQSGRSLVGSFVGEFGSARPVGHVHLRDGKLSFTVPPQYEGRSDDLHFEGRFEGDELRGETTDEKGRRITWSARRAPDLKRSHPPRWGEPIELFNGKDMTGWKPRGSEDHNGWSAKGGLMVNKTPSTDIITERKFEDFKIHMEFRYPRGSNSGLYLRGRYEVQIEDDFGQEADSHGIGGVYGFLTPSVNACKKAGEWQTMDVTLVGRVVTVHLNGERVIDRQTIPGITGGALESDEGSPGPIMIQGDHGPIEIRRVTLTPGS
jgi:hypothetical protein